MMLNMTEADYESWRDDLRCGGREEYDNQYTAASLYAGGWRADALPDLIEQFNLTGDEAERIYNELQKIDQNDIIRELFDLGMGGSFYAQVVKVPEEYPVEDLSTVLLYEPEKAAKIFAQLCGYTLLDKSGRVVTGRMPGQEEQK